MRESGLEAARRARRAAVAPGWGQLYNRQPIKLPFLYAGLGVFAYSAISANSDYLLYRRAYLYKSYQELVDSGQPQILDMLAHDILAADQDGLAEPGVAEGDGYRVTIGSQNFDYVAGKNETFEDVARGLKLAIDAAAVACLLISRVGTASEQP